MKRVLRSIIAATLLSLPVAFAQVPQTLNYQGRVAVQGVNFNGTGHFKFALIQDQPATQTATATATIGEGGAITGITLTSGGGGYFGTPPTVTITGEGSGATATVQMHPFHYVTLVMVTQPGSGYTAGTTTVTISSPPPFSQWSNNGSSVAGSEPTAAVDLPVANGLYSVQLGDTTLPNMTAPLPATAFGSLPMRLRVWFNDGTHGFQQMSPDQLLTTAPYAFTAQRALTVPFESITATEIAPSAITSSKLADGAVGASQLGDGAITSASLADGAVVSSKLAAGAVNSANLAPGAAAANLNAGGNQSVTLGAASFSGPVGIGKTNPQVPLDVVGDVRFLSNHIALGNATASGSPSVAIGNLAAASAANTVVAGYSASASGGGSLAFGNSSSASGLFSAAFGNLAEAHGDQSVALGAGARTYGIGGVAIGDDAVSNANYAVAIGFRVRANGGQSSAFGYACETNGASSLAAGYNSITNGYGSVAMGNQNIASGEGGCAVGNSTLAPNKGMLACGNYNPGNDPSEIFVVGSGSDANNRARAFWVTQNSDVGVTRDCYVGRNILYGGAVLQYSDERLKAVGEPYAAGIEAINQIQPLHFHYKMDNPKHLPSDDERIGVIAQSLRAALPEAVKEDADGYLSVDKDPVIWALVNSVKQLKAENAALRKRLDALEADRPALKP